MRIAVDYQDEKNMNKIVIKSFRAIDYFHFRLKMIVLTRFAALFCQHLLKGPPQLASISKCHLYIALI